MKITSFCNKYKLGGLPVVLFLVFATVLSHSVFGATLNLTATWTANSDPDVKEYRLYRTDVARTLIGTTPHPNTSYPFTLNVPDGSAATLLFVLTAVDVDNNESADSNLASFSYDLSKITLSGYIRDSAGAGISGVVIGGLPNNPITDANGYYSDTVSYGWTGTVTPSKSGYSFNPVSRSYSNVTSNQTSQNFTATALTFTISGNAGVGGAVLSYTDGSAKTATADSSGNYSFAVSYGWSGTVTPSKSGYSFSPVSRSYSNVVSNQTSQNFTATALAFTISGNAGVGGAVLSYTDGTAKTATADSSGNYAFAISYGWSGTVTPSKTGYAFSPTNRSYSNVTSNQTSQNFTATALTFTISGNAGVGGAVLSYTDGSAKTATADSSGNYSFAVSYGWTGTVTPSKSGYLFNPVSRSYSNLTSNQTSQNFTATALTFTISGNAGVGGAVLSYTDGTSKTATADSSGNYAFTVSYGWSGTVTPSKSGYSFSPVSRSYSNLTSNQTSQNFTATALTFTISGNAGVGSAVLSYTDGTAKTATADSSGNYAFTVSYGWTGTVTPSKSGYSFSPVSRSYSNVTTDQTSQNYTATVVTSEVISTPKTPKGPTSGYIGTSYKFSTSGSSSSLGSSHPVEYQFDWGDGTFSSWGSPVLNSYTQSHVWTVPGTYSVKAQARCKNHPNVLSEWSDISSISVQGKPFIQVTSPNGGENLVVGSTYRITWSSAYLNPSGTVYLFYWYNGAWHPIAALSSTESSFNWTIPRNPETLKSPKPSGFTFSTTLWIGNWVNGKWECYDKNDYNFRILYDAWLCKISGGDQGGATLLLDNGDFEGFGVSLELGAFRIAGSYGVDSQGKMSGTYMIYEFSNPNNVFYAGGFTGSIDSNSKKITLELAASDGTPVFNLSGTRLPAEPTVPEQWAASLSGSISGSLTSLNIYPVQFGDEHYSFMFEFSGTGSITGGGQINIVGSFYLTSTTISFFNKTNVYGDYKITGAIDEEGVFTGALNLSSGTISFTLTSFGGSKSTLAGSKITP